MEENDRFVIERERMVEEQLMARGIRSKRVLEAMQQVPRHRFVPPEHRHLAYADGPLPIGNGQTISQPYIVALMTQLLVLEQDDKVLEIGTGSGYQAAILGYLSKEVHTIERHELLIKRAAAILQVLGYTNVHVHLGDGSQGLPEYAPYNGIVVTAAAPRVPQPLLDQLVEDGRLVVPVGGRSGQFLERWYRRAYGYDSDQIVPVAFVPLLGEHGWKENRWRWG